MTPPPGPPDDPAAAPADAGLVAGLRQLHAAVERIDAVAAARLGIARSDLRCLTLLEDGPLPPRILGERLGLASGSVTALIDRLEERSLARRRPDPADRRGVLVEASALARIELARLRAPLGEALARLAGRYGPDAAAEAARHLSDIARICDWVAGRIGEDRR